MFYTKIGAKIRNFQNLQRRTSELIFLLLHRLFYLSGWILRILFFLKM